MNNGYVMNSEELRSLAGKIDTDSGTLASLATTLNGHSETILGAWTGDGADAFRSAMETVNTKLNEMSANLSDISANLKSTAQIADDTAAQNQATINGVIG
jgi:WXG100 family type VII secretion target